MSVILRHCDELRRLTNAACGLVHHAGKDGNKGSRGWSGIKGPLDAQFLISKNEDGSHLFWIEKMKDDRDSYGYNFKIETVNFGMDDDGDVLSSCVVVYNGKASAKKKSKSLCTDDLASEQRKVFSVLQDGLENDGVNATKDCVAEAGGIINIHNGKVLMINKWQNTYVQSRNDIKSASAQRLFRGAKQKLAELRKIKIFGEWVWIPENLEALSAGVNVSDRI